MRYIIWAFLVSLCAANHPTTLRSAHGRYIRIPGKVASRRQAVSYFTNVIHQDPKHPEQTAQSSIKVNFMPDVTPLRLNQQHQIQQKQQEQVPRVPETKVTKYSQPHYQQQQESFNFSDPFKQEQHQYQQQEETTYIRQTQQYPSSNQNHQNYARFQQQTNPLHQDQSQLFNVGYSVKFTDHSPRVAPTNQVIRRQKISDGEIITGTRKSNEKVDLPDLSPSAQEFVSNSLVANAHHRISGIKPKKLSQYSTTSSPVPDAKTILERANLSPNTQKYFRALEQISNSNQPKAEALVQPKPTWQNVSPSVEIFKSRELPGKSEIVTPVSDKPRYFDHANALGGSQGFDYSNAVDVSPVQNQIIPVLQQAASSSQLSSSVFPSAEPASHSSSFFQTSPSSSQHSIHNELNAFLPNPASENRMQIIPTTDIQTPANIPLILPPVTNPKNQASTAGSFHQNFQNFLKFPIDTRLLREPVLTTDTHNLPNNPNLIPIHFDTRLMQEMQHQLNSYQTLPNDVFPVQSQVSTQYAQPANLPVPNIPDFFSQNYYPSQLKPSQQEVEKQPQNFSPSNPSQQGFYSNQGEPTTESFDKKSDSHQRYKIYGKPQPEKHSENHRQRQPRNKHVDHKLRTNLRPPPLGHFNYHRRVFVGK